MDGCVHESVYVYQTINVYVIRIKTDLATFLVGDVAIMKVFIAQI